MERAQKEYYLNEKMKAIQKELGRKDDRLNEIEELRKKIELARMPKDAEDKALQELKRLESMPPMSAEATVSRNYLDWLIAVPWSKRTRERKDLLAAEKILNEDHYGLEKVKERIVEFLAVRQLVNKPKGPILCFVGPPGVGKTSLAKSIARCTNRKFVRLSPGRRARRGRDPRPPPHLHRRLPRPDHPDDEEGGHARTRSSCSTRSTRCRWTSAATPRRRCWRCSTPSRTTASPTTTSTSSSTSPSVFFIATANVLHTIPQALQDRMEVLRLPGYTEREKVEIAKRHLIPKQIKSHGLEEKNIAFTDDALQEVIRRYTREAGVRNMEREISSDLPQGRAQGRAGGQGLPRRRSRPTNVHDLPRHPPLPEVAPGGAQRDRHRHRPGLDRGGRRDPAHRGHADARQGPADASPASSAT